MAELAYCSGRTRTLFIVFAGIRVTSSVGSDVACVRAIWAGNRKRLPNQLQARHLMRQTTRTLLCQTVLPKGWRLLSPSAVQSRNKNTHASNWITLDDHKLSTGWTTTKKAIRRRSLWMNKCISLIQKEKKFSLFVQSPVFQTINTVNQWSYSFWQFSLL